MSKPGAGYLAITVAATLWGIAGATAKYLFANTAIDPFLLVQVRMGLSFLVLVLALAFLAPRLLLVPRGTSVYVAVWGIGGMAAVQFTYLLTISETNVATAIFLQYLAPILTALYSWAFERQPLRPLIAGCLLLATLGSFLLIFGGTSQLLVSPLGLLSGLASAVFLSFYTILGARGLDRLSPWTLLCYGLGAGFLFWLAVDGALALAGRAPHVAALGGGAGIWGFFFYIAVLATVVPFGLYLTGLRHVAPTQATITGMLEPVVGGVVAYLALGEQLRLVQVLGGCLIVAAVIVLQARRARAAEPVPE